VNNFVSTNRNSLTSDVHGLAKVTNVLSKEKEAITQFTDLAPLALSDLSLSYDPEAKTLDTKSDTAVPFEQGGPSGAVCQLLHTLGLDALIPAVEGCGSSSSNAIVTPKQSHHHASSLNDLLGVRR
jgi:hypothetical protein